MKNLIAAYAAVAALTVFVFPNHAPAQSAQDLCGTMAEWMKSAEGKAFAARAKLTGTCPLFGSCDNPANRDAAVPTANTPYKIVPLAFQVIANDDGSNSAGTPAEIQAQVDNLNADFAAARIHFVYSMRTISNSTFRSVGAATGEVMRATLAQNPGQQINVYVTRYTNFNNCGIATFPWAVNSLTATGGMRLQDFSVAPSRFAQAASFADCVSHE